MTLLKNEAQEVTLHEQRHCGFWICVNVHLPHGLHLRDFYLFFRGAHISECLKTESWKNYIFSQDRCPGVHGMRTCHLATDYKFNIYSSRQFQTTHFYCFTVQWFPSYEVRIKRISKISVSYRKELSSILLTCFTTPTT